MFKDVLKKELVVPAHMSYLKSIRDFIEDVGHQNHYSEKVVNSFKLVIDEACTNIIRHGYLDIPDGKIIIRAIVRKYSLTIVVIDQGITFDPRQAKNPDLKKYIDIGKKGGLGILMMRKLMDDIQYSITPEGNELRLTKKRDQFDANKLALLWDSLSMQSRFTVIASVIIIVLGFTSLFFFSINSRNEAREQVFIDATLKCQEYAKLSYEFIDRGNNLPAYQVAMNYRESLPEMINDAFLVEPDSTYLANSLSKSSTEKLQKYILPGNSVPLDSINGASIYQITIGDTLEVFDVSYPIISKDPANQGVVLAYAHLWINESYINVLQFRDMIKVIFLVLGITLAVSILVFVLIRRIINPFTQLADWVRSVGQGKLDQDEFDIDTSDELGEIAQAFKEMTVKFREAQVGLIEQQRLQKELQVAQEIQHMLLPQDFPQVKGYELASYYEAAKEVGGDLFDFVDVDEDAIGIIVADVSGKGVPGSMIMTMIRTALRLEAKGNKNAADVLARVNRFVTTDMRKGMFVTVFYIILDSRNRVVSYASAGHNPMILYRASTKQTYYMNPQGFPVGISLPDIRLFDKTIENDRINLRSDDIIVSYTDGITEAMNSSRELFGDERFLEVIRENGHLPVQDFIRNIRDAIRNFTKGFQQNDDITMVAIKEKMSAEEVRVDVQKELFRMVDEEKIPVVEACDALKVSQFTYYKYRPIVDKYGFEGLMKRLQKKDDIELRHLSVEVKAKILDIIGGEPEIDAPGISEILKTEDYGSIVASPQVILEELHRLKLDTPEKRVKFVKRGKERKFLKIPGSPLLTLDGQVIKDFTGTGVFAPIHKPKKRVFSNIEDIDKNDQIPPPIVPEESDTAPAVIEEAEDVVAEHTEPAGEDVKSPGVEIISDDTETVPSEEIAADDHLSAISEELDEPEEEIVKEEEIDQLAEEQISVEKAVSEDIAFEDEPESEIVELSEAETESESISTEETDITEETSFDDLEELTPESDTAAFETEVIEKDSIVEEENAEVQTELSTIPDQSTPAEKPAEPKPEELKIPDETVESESEIAEHVEESKAKDKIGIEVKSETKKPGGGFFSKLLSLFKIFGRGKDQGKEEDFESSFEIITSDTSKFIPIVNEEITETDETSDSDIKVDDTSLAVEDTEKSEMVSEKSELSAEEVTEDIDPTETDMAPISEPIPEIDPEIHDILNEFHEEDEEEVSLLDLFNAVPEDKASEESEIKEDEAQQQEKVKHLKKIKTYAELDDRSRSIYNDFYKNSSVLVDELDNIVLNVTLDVDDLTQVQDILGKLQDKTRDDAKLNRLNQTLIQLLDIIEMFKTNSRQKNDPVLSIISECLNFVSKKNILAEDVVKIRNLNILGLKKRSVGKKYGKSSKISLSRKKIDASEVRKQYLNQKA